MDDGPGEKVQLLDLSKMVNLWGSDNNSSCLTPLCFLEASEFFFKALELLVAPLANPDSTSHAMEYRKHHDFFAQS
jgi:hypothetical protein